MNNLSLENIEGKRYFEVIENKLYVPSLFEEVYEMLKYASPNSIIQFIEGNLKVSICARITPILNWIVSSIGETGLFRSRTVGGILRILNNRFNISPNNFSLNDITLLVEFNEYIFDNYGKLARTNSTLNINFYN